MDSSADAVGYDVVDFKLGPFVSCSFVLADCVPSISKMGAVACEENAGVVVSINVPDERYCHYNLLVNYDHSISNVSLEATRARMRGNVCGEGSLAGDVYDNSSNHPLSNGGRCKIKGSDVVDVSDLIADSTSRSTIVDLGNYKGKTHGDLMGHVVVTCKASCSVPYCDWYVNCSMRISVSVVRALVEMLTGMGHISFSISVEVYRTW